MTNSSKELGHAAEEIAADYLKKQGLEILESNYRTTFGEIDIICQEADILVFVEVKAKTSDCLGSPFDMVNFKKQEKLKKLAQDYIIQNEIEGIDYRIDVVALDFSLNPPKIDWIKSAVEDF